MTNKKTKIASLFLAVVLIFSSFTINLSNVFADDNLTQSLVTNFYKGETATYTVDNKTLNIQGNLIQSSVKYDKYAIVDYTNNNQGSIVKIFGSISTDGKYSASADLSGLPQGKNNIGFFIGKEGEAGLKSKFFIIIYRNGDKFYFKKSIAENSNDSFSEFLSMINPSTQLSLANLNGNDSIKQQAEKITASCKNNYDKIVAIHNWVANELYYDYDSLSTGIRGNNEPDFVFENKYCVCQGYAELANYMLRSIGVPSMWVAGYGDNTLSVDWDTYNINNNSANHAWNVAYDGTRWITFDSTWDSYNKYENATKEYNGFGYTYFDPTNQFFGFDHKTGMIFNKVIVTENDFKYDFEDGLIKIVGYTGQKTNLVIDDKVGAIKTGTFTSLINKITLGENISLIESGAIKKTTTICCYEGSYAYNYAVENGYNYEFITTTVENLEITNKNLSLDVDSSLTLTVNVTPFNATNKKLKFKSENESVATVDANGVVKGIAPGTAKITVSSEDGGATTFGTVTVNAIKVSAITVINESLSIEKGETLQLNVEVKPDNAQNKKLTYTSLNPDIFTVDNNGLITAKEKGTGSLKIKSDDGAKEIILDVFVYIDGEEILIEKITPEFEKYIIPIGTLLNINTTVLPTNATNKELTAFSKDESILKAEDNGFKAIKSGETTVEISAQKGSAKTSCIVIVYLYGDVDGDDNFNTLDALVILKHIARIQLLNEDELVKADYNNDGDVNTLDSLDILKKIAKLS